MDRLDNDYIITATDTVSTGNGITVVRHGLTAVRIISPENRDNAHRATMPPGVLCDEATGLFTPKNKIDQIREGVAYDFARFDFTPNLMEEILLEIYFKFYIDVKWRDKRHEIIIAACNNPEISCEFWFASYRARHFALEHNRGALNGVTVVPQNITLEIFLKYINCSYIQWGYKTLYELCDKDIITNELLVKLEPTPAIINIIPYILKYISTDVYLKYYVYNEFANSPLTIVQVNELYNWGVLNDEILLHHKIPNIHLRCLGDKVSLDVLEKYPDVWNYKNMNNPNMTWEFFKSRHEDIEAAISDGNLGMLSRICPLKFIRDNLHIDWEMKIVMGRQSDAMVKSAKKV